MSNKLQQDISSGAALVVECGNDIFTDPLTGMEFVFVSGGEYLMGDTFGDGYPDEQPAHPVRVDDFWIGKYPVTQEVWEKVMGNNPSCFKEGSLSLMKILDHEGVEDLVSSLNTISSFLKFCVPSEAEELGLRYPVENVTWNEVGAFIRKINNQSGLQFRLPKEAEWEYAAREQGGKVRFGTGKSSIGPGEANLHFKEEHEVESICIGGIIRKTTPVDKFPSNSLGLYDMCGNVWEWCSDWYGESYYLSSPRNNPSGILSGTDRVMRGGSWDTLPQFARATSRDMASPGYSSTDLGFRLAMSAEVAPFVAKNSLDAQE